MRHRRLRRAYVSLHSAHTNCYCRSEFYFDSVIRLALTGNSLSSHIVGTRDFRTRTELLAIIEISRRSVLCPAAQLGFFQYIIYHGHHPMTVRRGPKEASLLSASSVAAPFKSPCPHVKARGISIQKNGTHGRAHVHTQKDTKAHTRMCVRAQAQTQARTCVSVYMIHCGMHEDTCKCARTHSHEWTCAHENTRTNTHASEEQEDLDTWKYLFSL